MAIARWKPKLGSSYLPAGVAAPLATFYSDAEVPSKALFY